jgi:hypothetical protein
VIANFRTGLTSGGLFLAGGNRAAAVGRAVFAGIFISLTFFFRELPLFFLAKASLLSVLLDWAWQGWAEMDNYPDQAIEALDSALQMAGGWYALAVSLGRRRTHLRRPEAAPCG